MGLLLERLRRYLRRNPGPLVVAMLLLLVLQLGWWLIFFDREYATVYELERERYAIALELSDLRQANNLPSAQGAVESRLADLSESHQRRMVMLIHEGVFVLILLGYGTFRVFRSVVRERQLVSERNLFLQSVTHELKTPMSTIQLNLQTLQRHRLKASEQRELIEESLDEIRRLEEQVNNLLLGGELLRQGDSKGDNESASSATETTLSDATLNLADEIRSYLEAPSSRRLIESYTALLRLELDEQLQATIDRELLQKMLSNLIGNALRYSGKGCLIELRLIREYQVSSNGERESGVALLEVNDDGPGVEESQLEAIFQPLYRLQDEAARQASGSGMGLYIVRQIAERHGGSAKAYSPGRLAQIGEATRKGTTFEIRLPLTTT